MVGKSSLQNNGLALANKSHETRDSATRSDLRIDGGIKMISGLERGNGKSVVVIAGGGGRRRGVEAGRA